MSVVEQIEEAVIAGNDEQTKEYTDLRHPGEPRIGFGTGAGVALHLPDISGCRLSPA